MRKDMAKRNGLFNKLCDREWDGNLLDHPIMPWDMPLLISFLAVEETRSAEEVGCSAADEGTPPSSVNPEKLGIVFDDKPILVGGAAMEYYGIRKRGDDYDFIVSARDYRKLEAKYRDRRKDMWGDFGVRVGEFELFRSMYKFDYSYFDSGSIELERVKVVSIDILFRMQVFAMGSGEKRKRDVELLKEYFMRFQNSEYRDYMNRNAERYLGVEDGLILNGDYY